MADEVLAEIKDTLDSLVSSDKAPITVLSMLAEENMQYAPGIASAIEERIKTAPANLKLPALYLVDSIIKNHKSPDYLNLFAKNIVSVFVSAFEKVDEKTRMAMYKLRQTWPKFFSNDTLLALDLAIKNIDPAWPVTAKVNKTPEIQTDIPQPQQVHLNPDFFSKAKEALKGLTTTNSNKVKAVQPSVAERVGVTPVLSHHASVSTLIPALSPSLLSSPAADVDPEMLLSKQIMAKQLLAKQQELLQIQQRRLEIELAKAQLQIEMQAKQLAEHKLAGELKKQQLVPLLSPKDKSTKKSPKGKKAKKLSQGDDETTTVGVETMEVTEAPDSSKRIVEVLASEFKKTSPNVIPSEAILVATSKTTAGDTTQDGTGQEAVSPSKLQGKKRKSSDVVKIDPRLKKKMLLGSNNFQAIEDKPAVVTAKQVEVHSNQEDSRKEVNVAKVLPEVSTKKAETESKLSEDLKDLFGSEDKDFRMKPPPMPPSSLVVPSQQPTTQWKTLSSPPEFGIDRVKKPGNNNRVHPYARQNAVPFNRKALLPTPSGARGGRQVKENYEKLREIKGELDKEMERLNSLCYDPNANDDFEAFEADVKRNNSLLNKARWNGKRQQQQERGRRQLRAQQRSSFLPPPPRMNEFRGRSVRSNQFNHKQSQSGQFYQQCDQSNYNHESDNFYNNENDGYPYNDQYNDDPRGNDYSNNSNTDNRYDYYNENSRSPVHWGGRGGYRKGSRRGTPPPNRQRQSPPFQGESFSNTSFSHHMPNFNSTKASLPLPLQNLFSGFQAEPQNQQQSLPTTAPTTAAPALPQVDIHQLFSKLTQFGILSKNVPVKEETDDKKLKRVEMPDLSDFDPKKMAIKYPSSIDSLYSGNSCKTCGLQFCQRSADKDRGEEATKWRYMMHLDWHFKGNEIEDMASSADKHRSFYKDLSDWYKFDEENHVAADLPSKEDGSSEAEASDTKPGTASLPLVILKSKPTSPLEMKLEEMKEKYKDELKENPLLVEMKEKEEVCFMCHDGFDTFWDDERNEMCLKDTLLLTDKWFHLVCFTDFKGHEFYTQEDYPTGPSEHRTSRSSSTPSSAVPENVNIALKIDDDAATVTRDDAIPESQSTGSTTTIEMASDDSEPLEDRSTTEGEEVSGGLASSLHPIKLEVITE